MTDSHPRRGPRGGAGGPHGDRRGGRPRGPSGVDDPAARQRALAALHESLDHGNDPEIAARAALAVSEECVEAWLLLADFARSAMEARDLVRRAVETATHVLGEAGLREGRGRLGATADGVAYLHALAALARRQVGEDRAEQAIQTLTGLLAMDPSDPAQVRGDLLLLLLSEARDEEAEELVAAYPEEASADWMYGRALTKRRRALDDDALLRATAALDRAVARFPAEGRALGEGDARPRGTPPADPVVRGAWEATEGALEWLRERLAAGAAGEDAPSRPRTEADRDADRRFDAREHVAEALDAGGARREELARAALSIWPDCADAWSAIAATARSPAEKVAALREATAAALRALGRDPADEPAPAGDSEDARSLFAARVALAEALDAAGDEAGAMEEERRLLAEDPDDVAGAAVGAVARLTAAGRHAEAAPHLLRHEEDAAAGWTWLRVLEALRAGSRTQAAFALAEAMLTSPMTAALLVSKDARLPKPEGAAAAAAQREAERAARAIFPAWAAVPGALVWLASKRPPPPAPSRGGPRGRRR